MRHQILISLVLVLAVFSCKHVPDNQDSAATDAVESAKNLIANSEYREALRELLRAHELDSSSSEVEYLLATVYLIGFNRLDDSKEHVLNAIKMRKKPYPEAENLAGAVFLELGKPLEAIQYLEKAAKNLLYDTPYFAEQNLGRAYAELGNTRESVLHYKNAISAQPMLCSAYIPYADQLENLSQYREAEENLLQFSKRCDANDAQAQAALKRIKTRLQK